MDGWARYEQRYVPGQKIYLRQCNPKQAADAIVDNNDFLPNVLFASKQRQIAVKSSQESNLKCGVNEHGVIPVQLRRRIDPCYSDRFFQQIE